MAPTLVHGPSAVKSLQSDRRTTPLGYIEVPDVQPSRQSVLDRARQARAEEGRRIVEKAAGSIWLDDGVGAVLGRLDDLGLADKTLVLLASDNGNVAKFTCYDGGARLPMVARWKDVIQPGAVCGKLVSNLDFAPTLFEIAGIKPPSEMLLDGQSIVKALKGDPSYRRDSLFLEITTERAVVTGDSFKYIAVRYLPEVQKQVDRGEEFNHWCQPLQSATHTYRADERYPGYFDQDQLYDLNEDPAERKNLAGEPAGQARLARMQDLLRRYSATLPHTFGEFKAE
jgi:arylsulfatase A-like enzyme